eukprot:CAMPEP_0176156180 /NCGR_PEP_ID=MMETSP0120_2-20121206/79827_1 /TAXON_ID=160619 /ORGANISM="Kryptoperidinium foliaceum, Strain CCMP 1326" /LENGTH=50 /DNA_ID=CAMNT_0017493387 /DNA_START=56 /DNA_END=208 /DNA_ORIENTATION=+
MTSKRVNDLRKAEIDFYDILTSDALPSFSRLWRTNEHTATKVGGGRSAKR